MSKYLVRIYIPQGDKDNTIVDSWDEALKLVGKTEKDKYTEVKWLNYTDHYFNGTDNYIREIL